MSCAYKTNFLSAALDSNAKKINNNKRATKINLGCSRRRKLITRHFCRIMRRLEQEKSLGGNFETFRMVRLRMQRKELICMMCSRVVEFVAHWRVFFSVCVQACDQQQSPQDLSAESRLCLARSGLRSLPAQLLSGPRLTVLDIRDNLLTELPNDIWRLRG